MTLLAIAFIHYRSYRTQKKVPLVKFSCLITPGPLGHVKIGNLEPPIPDKNCFQRQPVNNAVLHRDPQLGVRTGDAWVATHKLRSCYTIQFRVKASRRRWPMIRLLDASW